MATWLSSGSVKSCLDAGRRIYAVGDIHGQLDLLREMKHRIEADVAGFLIGDLTIVFLGDYVDRGPDSSGVLEFLSTQTIAGQRPVALRGNHELMMLRFIDSVDDGSHWFSNGGLETIASYGVCERLGDDLSSRSDVELREALIAAMPAEHRAFLDNLPNYLEVGDYLFVHAGVRPGVPLEQQSVEDLLWIRDEFYDAPDPISRYVVHGHTVVDEPLVLPRRADIDTGAWFSGRLTCLVVEADERRVLGGS